MLGTATLNGEKVIIMDVAGGEALVTPGNPLYLQWVSMDDLTQLTWVVG